MATNAGEVVGDVVTCIWKAFKERRLKQLKEKGISGVDVIVVSARQWVVFIVFRSPWPPPFCIAFLHCSSRSCASEESVLSIHRWN